MMDPGTILIWGVILGLMAWDYVRKPRAEARAQAALQPLLEAGEGLIGFLRTYTLGESTATVMLGGWIAEVVRSVGQAELYVGLTPRRLILAPAKPADARRPPLVIPSEAITAFEVQLDSDGPDRFNVHTGTGKMALYLANDANWASNAHAMKRAFAALPAPAQDAASTPASSLPFGALNEDAAKELAAAAADERMRRLTAGRPARIIGMLAIILAVVLTVASALETTYTGICLLGVIALMVGVAQSSKAGRGRADEPRWE